MSVVACTLIGCVACSAPGVQGDAPVHIDVLVYGRSIYPASRTTTSLPVGHRVPFIWSVLLIRTGSQNILIDTGFTDPQARKTFRIDQYFAPADLLRRSGVSPEQITDVVLTHAHFDHADGVSALPRARIHIHVDALRELRKRWGAHRLLPVHGRLQVFHSQVPMGPLTLVPVGGHAPGSSVARMKTWNRTFLFVGDECYLAQDCLLGRPLPQGVVVNHRANEAFVRALAVEARTSHLVVLPNHDPEILRQCPADADICRIHPGNPSRP